MLYCYQINCLIEDFLFVKFSYILVKRDFGLFFITSEDDHRFTVVAALSCWKGYRSSQYCELRYRTRAHILG